MKPSLLALILCLTVKLLPAQPRTVCFTIDDLPLVSYGMNDPDFQRGLIDGLTSALVRNHIPAIGFVNEIKLYRNDTLDPFQVGLLEKWVSSGLDLGNHTWSHADYNTVSCHAFCEDILKGENVSRDILNRHGKLLRYFRHPYLHIGNTRSRADSLNAFLKKHHYIAAPVTIDNEDYLFALAYKRAFTKGDTNLMSRIGRDYITYIGQKISYFEQQASRLFGRPVSQLMLSHASLLNATYMDSLAALFRSRGYEFVTLEEALKDPVYQQEITVFGNWGISWIDLWALSMGKKGDFFRDEPVTPEYIRELSAN